MAQVYSQNAVGYINVTCGPQRYSMIAHQLLTGADRTIGTLIPTAATGTQFLYLGVGGFSTAIYDPDEGGWTNPTLNMDLGGGAYLFNPSATSQTFTFVGEVAQGALSTPITVNNFLFRSSRVPQTGLLQTDLQFTPTSGDSIFKLSAAGAPQTFIYDGDDGWTPGEPTIAVGEAFMLKAALPHLPWNRTFSVN